MLHHMYTVGERARGGAAAASVRDHALPQVLLMGKLQSPLTPC